MAEGCSNLIRTLIHATVIGLAIVLMALGAVVGFMLGRMLHVGTLGLIGAAVIGAILVLLFMVGRTHS